MSDILGIPNIDVNRETERTRLYIEAMSLEARLKELSANRKRGWQAALARHCEVKPSSVSDWVSGETKSIEGENLVRAAAFFGVRPEWLATGRGSKMPGTTDLPGTQTLSDQARRYGAILASLLDDVRDVAARQDAYLEATTVIQKRLKALDEAAPRKPPKRA